VISLQKLQCVQDLVVPFRSQCCCKLGMYEQADADADQVLKVDRYNVRGLINKAEMQYNLGNFEHSMKYFHRLIDRMKQC